MGCASPRNIATMDDLEEILGGPSLRAEDIPPRKSDAIALGRRLSERLLPFWQPDASWLSSERDGLTSNIVCETGYRLLPDFLVVVTTLLDRYGVGALEKAMSPFTGVQRGIPPKALGSRAERIMSISQQSIAMLIAFQIRSALDEIGQLPATTVATGDAVVVALIRDLVKGRPDDEKIDSDIRMAVVQIGLIELERVLKGRRERPSMWLSGPFTNLNLADFVALSRRTDTVLARFGAKNVESEFETQLSLIAQSFGFYVVRAQRARRRVDLFCLVPDGGYTALIEAKTTAATYSLPADDERALIEYVGNVRASLGTLPSVAFVLLVGPEASTTLEKKLAGLEAELALPVRFLAAETLARLRDQLPGPVPAPAFRDALISSRRRILGGEFADGIITAFSRVQEAHTRFVDDLMEAKVAGFSKGDPG
jgi:hypothetical protein